MRRKYHSSKLQRIDDILQKTLKKHKIPLEFEDRRLTDLWLKAVGANIAAQTRPDVIKRSVLFVKVANSAWMQQLHFMKQDIIEKFNHLHQQAPVRDICFAIGEFPASASARRNRDADIHDNLPLKVRDKKMIELSLAAIADEELRVILRDAMTKEIIRRRTLEKRQSR